MPAQGTCFVSSPIYHVFLVLRPHAPPPFFFNVVEYFRPRKHRTAVYHEILVAYLDWLRRRGFKAAHIWSCPPQRGNNFIFWCHPLHQKTPTRDRLSGWYGNMLK